MIKLLAAAVLYIEFACMICRLMSVATEGEGEE